MKPIQVSVVQNPDSLVPVEVLAESIKAISQGMKKLLAGPLTEEVIVLLVTNASPQIGPKYSRSYITKPQVRAMLQGLESLEKKFLKVRK